MTRQARDCEPLALMPPTKGRHCEAIGGSRLGWPD
jgi:hypothetical protein